MKILILGGAGFIGYHLACKLSDMKEVLNLNSPPDITLNCEKCAYLRGGKKYF